MAHYHEWITADPYVLSGKPVVKDTRIPVELILDELAHGATPGTLQEAYPRLTYESIMAALAFAADVVRALDV